MMEKILLCRDETYYTGSTLKIGSLGCPDPNSKISDLSQPNIDLDISIFKFGYPVQYF